jgi:hypothetical protein
MSYILIKPSLLPKMKKHSAKSISIYFLCVYWNCALKIITPASFGKKRQRHCLAYAHYFQVLTSKLAAETCPITETQVINLVLHICCYQSVNS